MSLIELALLVLVGAKLIELGEKLVRLGVRPSWEAVRSS